MAVAGPSYTTRMLLCAAPHWGNRSVTLGTTVDVGPGENKPLYERSGGPGRR